MYTKNPQCDISKMEETVIVMKKDDNSLHVLNETASLIWEYIEDSSINDIVEMIVSKYISAPIDVVLQDVRTTIDSFIAKGLLIN